MLETNLKHVETVQEFDTLLAENDKVMICCGRMGPMCLPVYDVMEKLEPKYAQVAFRDMDFDSPVARETIRRLPQVQSFGGLPFTVYFRDGKLMQATSSIQTKQQVTAVLDQHLA